MAESIKQSINLIEGKQSGNINSNADTSKNGKPAVKHKSILHRGFNSMFMNLK